MKKAAVVAGLLSALVAATLVKAAPDDGGREGRRERLREGPAGTAAADAARPLPAAQVISYGKDPAQSLNFWHAENGSRPGAAPLIVFVHGGGWSRGSKDNATGHAKARHYPAQGYAFASIDYRLVPGVRVEQQAADVAAAVRTLLDRAGDLGIDRHRVVLMGHSAGAHLVALVGTDEQYLRGAGLSLRDIDGVIPIDGAAYDVPRQLADAGPRMRQTYTAAFGTDPARQRQLSPITHAAAPNAAAFLLPHVQRQDGVRQSQDLAAALTAVGTPAETASIPGQGLIGHLEINRKLGQADYPATAVVDAWLKRVFAS